MSNLKQLMKANGEFGFEFESESGRSVGGGDEMQMHVPDDFGDDEYVYGEEDDDDFED